ncbi:MAG: DNA polymerase III subunit delta [Planctomycetota bacterium]
MPAAPTGLEYLLSPSDPPGALTVVSGEDGFVRGEVVRALRERLVGDGDADLDWRVFTGAEAEWVDVADAVQTRSLFGGGGRQVACVEEADPLVTRSRDAIEAFAQRGGGSVVLCVKSLPGNTRLGKAVAAHGLHVRCAPPTRGPEVAKHRRDAAAWLTGRAQATHRVTLGPGVIDLLFDLLPMSVGLIDQEIARLALLAGDDATLPVDAAREHVGGWRTQTAWELIDAAVDGDAASALRQLDRLLLSGEQPIGLLAQVGSTLRKFAAAATHYAQSSRGGRGALGPSLKAAGFPPFKLGDAERQLRQIGRVRAEQLTGWLLDADLAMKGYNSQPDRARIELERLLVRLSRAASPAASSR